MKGINELKQKIESDKDFREDLQRSESAQDFLNKISYAGFDVKPEEFLEISKKEQDRAQKLNDSEFEAVSGGGFWGDFWEGFKFGFIHPIDGIKIVIEELQK